MNDVFTEIFACSATGINWNSVLFIAIMFAYAGGHIWLVSSNSEICRLINEKLFGWLDIVLFRLYAWLAD